MKAIEQYFPVVLFVILCKTDLLFQSEMALFKLKLPSTASQWFRLFCFVLFVCFYFCFFFFNFFQLNFLVNLANL